MHAAPVSVSSYVINPAVFRRSCFHGVLYSLGSYFLSQGPLSPEMGELIDTSHFELSIPRSLTVCTLSSCGFMYLFPYLLREKSSLMVNKTLVYEYSRMLLGAILLLFSFSRTIVLRFPLGPWPI